MPLARRALLVLWCALLCPSASAAPAAGVAAARPSVAVLYFDYSGKNEDLASLRKGLTQMLISDLANDPTQVVVERERLEAVLQEQKLASSGKLDPQTAAKVGRLLGARRLVLGGYFELGRVLRVDARLVDVETGRVLGSVGANGKPDEFLGVEQEVARGLGRLLCQAEPTPAPSPAAAASSPAATPPATRPAPRPRAKPPARLRTTTAISYGKALSALDQGDKAAARQLLEKVVLDQSDFDLAARDLDQLIQ